MDIGANPYETLLIPKDATASDIRKAYYKLALEFHPDKQTPSASVEDLSKCKVKFQQIGIAYAVLSDEEQRAYYDAVGEMKDQFGTSNQTKNAYKSGSAIYSESYQEGY